MGNGPFPTELLGDEGDELREAGGEYGATTGRPRRCGWFDLVGGRYAVDINGATGVIITKLDVLDDLDTVRVGIAYDLDGEQLTTYPTNAELLCGCRPVYRDFPGWDKPTRGCRRLIDLPAGARKYLEFLEAELGALIVGVSVGAERDEMIWTPTGVTL